MTQRHPGAARACAESVGAAPCTPHSPVSPAPRPAQSRTHPANSGLSAPCRHPPRRPRPGLPSPAGQRNNLQPARRRLPMAATATAILGAGSPERSGGVSEARGVMTSAAGKAAERRQLQETQVRALTAPAPAHSSPRFPVGRRCRQTGVLCLRPGLRRVSGGGRPRTALHSALLSCPGPTCLQRVCPGHLNSAGSSWACGPPSAPPRARCRGAGRGGPWALGLGLLEQREHRSAHRGLRARGPGEAPGRCPAAVPGQAGAAGWCCGGAMSPSSQRRVRQQGCADQRTGASL